MTIPAIGWRLAGPHHRPGPTPRPRIVAPLRPLVLVVALLLVAVLATVKGRSDDDGDRPTSVEASASAARPAMTPRPNPDLPITFERGVRRPATVGRLRVGRRVRPRHRAGQDAERLRPAVRARVRG